MVRLRKGGRRHRFDIGIRYARTVSVCGLALLKHPSLQTCVVCFRLWWNKTASLPLKGRPKQATPTPSETWESTLGSNEKNSKEKRGRDVQRDRKKERALSDGLAISERANCRVLFLRQLFFAGQKKEYWTEVFSLKLGQRTFAAVCLCHRFQCLWSKHFHSCNIHSGTC